MAKTRILLADDHRLVAEGLRSLLEPDFELVAIVEDGRALLEAAERYWPEVVVVDVSMPLLNGIEAVRILKKKNDMVKVVFLTMHVDVDYALSALDAGASGYVLKHSAATELLTAIDYALKGKTYVTPLLAAQIEQHRQNQSTAPARGLAALTRRQREVLQLLAEGHSTKEAAAILDISARTVEFHKYGMMETLGLKSTAELMHFAFKHKLR